MSYTINSDPFEDWNMQVSSCKGFLDMPGRLGEAEHDWEDANGVEPYVESADLKWNGREIQVFVFYNGSDMTTDVEDLIDTISGAEVPLVTNYGTYTVSLKSISPRQIFVPQEKGILEITFWEPMISVPSVPTAVGGSGLTLGSYDFLQDFGLHLKNAKGYNDIPSFNARALTYGDVAQKISQYRKNRKIVLSLNGKYASVSSLVENIEDLHAVLRSSGTKTLTYRGVAKPVYFADKATIDTNIYTRTVRFNLTLRVSE